MDRFKCLNFCGMSANKDQDQDNPPDRNNAHSVTFDFAAIQESSDYAETGGKLENRNDEWVGQKETVKVLEPESVRWFYKQNNGKYWVAFNGFDSLQLEYMYRTLIGLGYEVLRNTSTDGQSSSRLLLDVKNSNLGIDDPSGTDRDKSITAFGKVVVRGSLYEVDLLTSICSSIYWSDDYSEIRRGTWFYESLQPLEHSTCEVMETVHLSLFANNNESQDLFAEARSAKKVIHSEVIGEYIVDWYSSDEVYLYQKTKVVRSISQKIGGYFQKTSGSRLLRGYKELATPDDQPKEISHLVFVVHGIGQKVEIGGRITRNTSMIRQNVHSLQERYFPMSSERAEFFPVDWRMSLDLDEGDIFKLHQIPVHNNKISLDGKMKFMKYNVISLYFRFLGTRDLISAITQKTVMPLRNFLNSTAMDILYYTSPIYCSAIQNNTINELNRLYKLFRKRNPSNDARCSIIAHSLGCIITYDIITGFTQDPMLSSCIKSSLDFHVENFFCIGSPLAVFLALRLPPGQDARHLITPNLCDRMFNIFHLADPIAYRIEPLIIRDYYRIAPVRIRSYSSAQNIAYNNLPLEVITGQEKEEWVHQCNSPIDLSRDASTDSTNNEKKRNLWNRVKNGSKTRELPLCASLLRSIGNGLDHRLDYVLRSSAVSVSYISTVTCHNGYWANPDFAYFVLTQIFSHLEAKSSFAISSVMSYAKLQTANTRNTENDT